MKLQELLKKYLSPEQFTEIEGMLEVENGKIPKERFDEVNNKYKELKELNASMETQMNELKSNPENEKLNKELEKITKQLEVERTKAETYEKDLIEKEKSFILKETFDKFKVQDQDYIKFKLGELEYKDGQITGLEEKLKELASKEETKQFFKAEEIINVNTNNKDKQNKTNNTFKSIEDLKGLTAQEYLARKDEVDLFLSSQNGN